MPPQVCISYDPADAAAYAARLRNDLSAVIGADVLSMDDAAITPGESFTQQIRDRLRRSDIVLLVLSPRSVSSDWVHDEAREALRLDKRVIPVLVGGLTQLTPDILPRDLARLAHLQAFQLADVSWAADLHRLAAALAAGRGVAAAYGFNPFVTGPGLLALLAVAALLYFTARDESPPPAPVSPAPTIDYSVVDDVLGTLELARIAFNPPEQMDLGESAVIDAAVSLSLSAEALASRLPRRDGADATVQTDAVKVSDVVEVTLRGGSGFRVDPLTAARQAVGREDAAEWRWAVTATGEGQQPLFLTVDALLTLNGRDVPRTMRTYERTIYVRVSPGRSAQMFVAEHWDWIGATILVPLFVWAWKNRGAWRRR